MPRIRVARIITRLNVGGPAIQALLLTRRLDPARFEPRLICGRPDPAEGNMTTLRPEEGVTLAEVPELHREIAFLDDARAFARLVAILRGYRPHVVHTHLAKAGLLGRLAARAVGVPVVVHTFHGNVLRGYFGSARSRFFLTLERALARISTRVIAISDRQARELEELRIAPRDRIAKVPLGLDLAPFLVAESGRFRAELGVGPGAPLVGIVARLVPIKGVELFLEAAARIHAERADAVFAVVGDGELRAALERRASELGLSDHVRFTGWRADLPSIYADLDVVALTSRNEGTPVSVIEALAAGRAVVATAVGGVPDLVDDGRTGSLAREGDAADVARRIVDLIGDPGRRSAFGAAGRAAVYPEHDSSTLVQRIDELYTKLVRSSRGEVIA